MYFPKGQILHLKSEDPSGTVGSGIRTGFASSRHGFLYGLILRCPIKEAFPTLMSLACIGLTLLQNVS